MEGHHRTWVLLWNCSSIEVSTDRRQAFPQLGGWNFETLTHSCRWLISSWWKRSTLRWSCFWPIPIVAFGSPALTWWYIIHHSPFPKHLLPASKSATHSSALPLNLWPSYLLWLTSTLMGAHDYDLFLEHTPFYISRVVILCSSDPPQSCTQSLFISVLALNHPVRDSHTTSRRRVGVNRRQWLITRASHVSADYLSLKSSSRRCSRRSDADDLLRKMLAFYIFAKYLLFPRTTPPSSC